MKKIMLLSLLLTVLSACHKNDGTVDKPQTSVKTNINTSLKGIDSISTFANQFQNSDISEQDLANGVTVLAPINNVFTDPSVASLPNRSDGVATMMSVGNSPKTVMANNAVNTIVFKDGSAIGDYIIKGKFILADFKNGKTFTTLTGKTITVTESNGIIYLNSVKLFTANISTSGNYGILVIASLIQFSQQLAIDNTALDLAYGAIGRIPGSVMAIQGQNFSTKPEEDTVMIGTKRMLVNEAFANKLLVTVPADATSGTIRISTKGKTVTSKTTVPILPVNVSTLQGIANLNCQNIQGITVGADKMTLFFTDTQHGRVISYANGVTQIYQPMNPATSDVNGDGRIDNNDRTTVMNWPWNLTTGDDGKIYVATGIGNAIHYIFRLTAGNTNTAEQWAGGTGPALTGARTIVQMAPLAITNGGSNTILYSNNYGSQTQAGIFSLSNNTVNSWLPSMVFLDTDPTYIGTPSITGIARDTSTGDFYFADENSRIWKRSKTGAVTLFAGGKTKGHIDGIGTNAQIGVPFGLVVDGESNVFVCDNDYQNHNFSVRLINRYGVVTTLAGGQNSESVTKDGTGKTALFAGINSITMDYDKNLYTASDDGTIRVIRFH